MLLPESVFPAAPPARTAGVSPSRRSPSHDGALAGALGIVFGLLGIFSIGFIFVPIAALCSILGLLRGLNGRSASGVGMSLLGGALTFFGALVSPSVWALVAGGVVTGLLMPTAPLANPPISYTRSAPIVRTVPHVQTVAALAPQPLTVPRLAQATAAASEPEIVRDSASGQVMQISRLLRMGDGCDTPAELSGRVLSRDVSPPSAQPVGIAVQSSQGRRLYINIDADLDSYSRDTARVVTDGLRSLTGTGHQVTVRFKSCGGSGRPYLDSIAQVTGAPAGTAITTPRLKQCSPAFLKLWNDDRDVAFARLPKSPCLMPGETGAYVCDQSGCVRVSAWEAAQREKR